MNIEYKLVWEGSRQDLESAVRKLIEEGWEPVGGVSVSFAMVQESATIPGGGGIVIPRPRFDLLQAMVRRQTTPSSLEGTQGSE